MKKWQTPRLLVITREKPNISVLDFCKTGAYDFTGRPGGGYACMYTKQVELPCIIPPEPPPPGTGYMCPHPMPTTSVPAACAAVSNS